MVAKVHDHEKSDLPEATKAALSFMDAWMLGRAQNIDVKLFSRLQAHFSASQIVELTTLAGIYESVHKFNHLFELPQSEGVVGFKKLAPPAGLVSHMERLKQRRAGG